MVVSWSGLHAGTVFFPALDTTEVVLESSDDGIECAREDCRLGYHLAVTDLDADGIEDELATIKRFEEVGSPSMLATFLGPVEGVVDALDGEGCLTSEEFDRIGWELAVVGDLDIIGANQGTDEYLDNAGRAWLWHGPHSGIQATDDADVEMQGSVQGASLGYDITATGDLTGDGCDDIVTSEVRWPSLDLAYGRVLVYASGC